MQRRASAAVRPSARHGANATYPPAVAFGMGLLSIIRKVKAKEKEMRILMVGLDNAGKTTVVKRLCGQDTSTVSPTLGFSIASLTLGRYALNVWDVGGQKTLRAFWRNYYESTDGLVWVLDAADGARLPDVAHELASLLAEERLAGASLLVLANKQDLAGALSRDALFDALRLGDLARGGRHVAVVACSAATGDGLLAGVTWLVHDIAARIFVAE